jgi:hypothetical protein
MDIEITCSNYAQNMKKEIEGSMSSTCLSRLYSQHDWGDLFKQEKFNSLRGDAV